VLDASKLGIDLDRIQRGLRVADAREERRETPPLKLDIQIQVFGQAPKLDFFTDFPLDRGQVPWGAPTHRDVLSHLTPEEFRSPVMPFHALAFWAAQKLYEQGKKHDCARQLEEYRRQVMAGLNVAAPRCADR
jgi:hypothetical protein